LQLQGVHENWLLW